MDNITQKEEKENTKNKRYLPHDLKTKYNAVITYLNNGDIEYTCRKCQWGRRRLTTFKGCQSSPSPLTHYLYTFFLH